VSGIALTVLLALVALASRAAARAEAAGTRPRSSASTSA